MPSGSPRSQELVSATADCFELRAELEEAEDEIEQADSDLISVTESYLEAKQEAEGLAADVDQLIEVRNAQAAEIEDLQTDFSELKAELEDAEEELELADSDIITVAEQYLESKAEAEIAQVLSLSHRIAAPVARPPAATPRANRAILSRSHGTSNAVWAARSGHAYHSGACPISRRRMSMI